MLRLSGVSRAPPAWRDPEFPDIDPRVDPRNTAGSVWSLFRAMNRLQEERGLPPLDTSRPGRMLEGRPKLRLAWWDRKQKRVRGVEVRGDIVMRPQEWNRLHPEARRLLPLRLLPPGALCYRLLAPTPTPSGGDPPQ
jgi:hypothetical protein